MARDGGAQAHRAARDPLTRPEESRAIADLLERARRTPAALLLEGEAGIGKTTVWLRGIEDAAAEGFRVQVARGAPTEVTFAYAAVADLVRAVEDSTLAELPARQRTAINRLLLSDEDGPDTDERAVGAAFVAILQRMAADGPVLVAIDDAHWLDTASRAVLGFAVPRLAGRIALLVAARPGEGAQHDALAWLRLGNPGATARLRMRPLSLGATHALISQRLGCTLARPTLVRIHEISCGNPFFALELARAVTESGPQTLALLPDSLAVLVRERLAHLPGNTREVLLAVACCVSPTTALLAEITGQSVENLVELLDVAAEAGVVANEGNRVGFTHPLLAHGAYTLATPAQRRRMHRRLALVVEQSELRARHMALAAGGPDDETLAALDAAAASAAARGAPSVSAELIELAIGLGGDTAARRLRAADRHFQAGALEAAQQHLDTILDGTLAGELRPVALILQGAVHSFDDSVPAGVRAVGQAVEEIGDNPVLRVQALLILALLVAATGGRSQAIGHAAAAVRSAECLGAPALHSQALAVCLILGFLHGQGVDQTALQTALQCQDAQSAGFVGTRADAIAAVLAAWQGRLEEGRAGIGAVVRHCAERGGEIDVIWTASRSTMIDIWLGRYHDAAVTAAQALEHAEQIGGKQTLVEALTATSAVAAYTGDRDGAHTAARWAVERARGIGADFLARAPLTTLAFLDVSCGEYASAAATLEPLLADFDPEHDTEMVVGGFLPEAIEALVALGRSVEAEPLVAALEAGGARLGRAWMLAVGARGRAQIWAAAGDLEAAEQAAVAALDHHRGLPMPFETARTQLLLGQLQRRRRQRRAAAETLAIALSTFEELGSPLWAARARTELERLSAVSTEESGLTPAEARIARLAAAGRSNREIAAELSLAPKTVEMNLSAVYRKLGIRSRAQLHGRL